MIIKSLSLTWLYSLLQPFNSYRQISVSFLSRRKPLSHHTHRAIVNTHQFPNLPLIHPPVAIQRHAKVKNKESVEKLIFFRLIKNAPASAEAASRRQADAS